jgi:hypothetical protein
MAERELYASFPTTGEGDVSVKRRCTRSDSSVRIHGAVRGDGGGEVERDESRMESVHLGGASERRLSQWGEHVHSAGVGNTGGSRGGMYLDSDSNLVALRRDGRGSRGAYAVPVCFFTLFCFIAFICWFVGKVALHLIKIADGLLWAC